jgi:hypothetical protein
MPRLDYAFVCHSAIERDGLLSVLDAGIDILNVGSVPARVSFTLVARFTFQDSELGQPHVVSVVVSAADNDEVIARFDVHGVPARLPQNEPDFLINTRLIQGLPLELRRSGDYQIAIRSNGDEVALLGLRVKQALPSL